MVSSEFGISGISNVFRGTYDTSLLTATSHAFIGNWFPNAGILPLFGDQSIITDVRALSSGLCTGSSGCTVDTVLRNIDTIDLDGLCALSMTADSVRTCYSAANKFNLLVETAAYFTRRMLYTTSVTNLVFPDFGVLDHECSASDIDGEYRNTSLSFSLDGRTSTFYRGGIPRSRLSIDLSSGYCDNCEYDSQYWYPGDSQCCSGVTAPVQCPGNPTRTCLVCVGDGNCSA